jgi:Holliday junction resolvase
VNSKQKGKRGELELAKFLADRGFPARRGQQYAGGNDSPDIICESLGSIHFEAKRCEAGNLYSWLEQAILDAQANKIPVVAHRKNNRGWIAVMRLEDLLPLLAKV